MLQKANDTKLTGWLYVPPSEREHRSWAFECLTCGWVSKLECPGVCARCAYREALGCV